VVDPVDDEKRIQQLQAQKTDLEQIKLQVEASKNKGSCSSKGQIEQLQRDRTGAQELLDQVANTVSRAENLWLMSMSKKGTNLTMDGAAASLNSVANFITALKRSGYFQKVEIKDAKQDDKSHNVQTFLFTINAEIAPNGPAAAGTPAAKPASTPGAAGPAATAPAKKG
jgi:Tfp pilus assembly protein PilN